ncbi:MAG: hypothetical protein IID45_15810 [Planctomycetes bacterium]|nr:hypothetical protein [Planctomycetota bacterium]
MGHAEKQGDCTSRNTGQAPRILLVEDFPRDDRNLALQLEDAGFEVALACNERAAIQRFDLKSALVSPFNLVLLNLRVRTIDDSQVILELRNRGFAGAITIFGRGKGDRKSLRLHGPVLAENALHSAALDRLMDILTDAVNGQIAST